jgi:leucyl-tRNA synthetase
VAPGDGDACKPTEQQLRVLHKTIQVVTEDMEGLRFNTAISRLMEFVNFFTAQGVRPRACMDAFVLMLAPLAPHMAEELWSVLGHQESLARAPWPEYDERYTREDTIELAVQINGKVRDRFLAAASASTQELQAAALADAKVQKHLEGKTVRKVIVVPGKLINIVAG